MKERHEMNQRNTHLLLRGSMLVAGMALAAASIAASQPTT